MSGERRLRILDQLTQGGLVDLDMKRLCAVSADITRTNGAGIMLMAGDVPRGSVSTSDDVSDLIERLQYELGEGPCVDAYQQSRPVLEPDLVAPATPRWVAFAPPVIAAGAQAIFGFPLVVGAIRLGALDLYRDAPGPLTDEQHADAVVIADIAARAVLMLQAHASPGELAVELETGADLKFVVHQASGMVAAQLDVTIGQALVRLRAHAFGNERPLDQVATDIVARRLRFDGPPDEEDPGHEQVG